VISEMYITCGYLPTPTMLEVYCDEILFDFMKGRLRQPELICYRSSYLPNSRYNPFHLLHSHEQYNLIISI